METYKIAATTPAGGGYLEMWTRDGRRVPVVVPQSCGYMLKNGTRVMVHRNRRGDVLACSFGDAMVLTRFPTTRESIAEFIGEFKDVYELSLDSMMFRYALHRSLRKLGMTPTRSLVMDMMAYNYVHDIRPGR